MKNTRNSLAIAFVGLIAFSCGQNTVDSGKQTEFYVRGNCGMCEERIEKAVMEIDGVNKADWSVETKNLTVSYDSTKTNELKIQQTVANVGHETKTITSPQSIHDALPECCKKGGSM
jgi:periplasmic mercuric ion binding protein